jgi:hypothetical protein
MCPRPCDGEKTTKTFFAPFMIHETLPILTETAFGSHPCCVVSVTYVRTHCFHGGNTGSNPVGDAKSFQQLASHRQNFHRHKKAQLTELWRGSLCNHPVFRGFRACFRRHKKAQVQLNADQPPAVRNAPSSLSTSLWALRL